MRSRPGRNLDASGGVRTLTFDRSLLSQADVIVDALLGTGLSVPCASRLQQ